MLGFYFIFFAGTIVWMAPPFKQYRTSYFYFFLVPAISGPLMTFYVFVLGLNGNNLYPPFYLFQLAALVNTPWRRILFILSVLLIFIIPILEIGSGLIFVFCILIETAILIIVATSIIGNIVYKHLLNVFLLLLIIFLATDIFKLAAVALNLEKGVINFYIGASVQIIFGLLFCFINENTMTISIQNPKK